MGIIVCHTHSTALHFDKITQHHWEIVNCSGAHSPHAMSDCHLGCMPAQRPSCQAGHSRTTSGDRHASQHTQTPQNLPGRGHAAQSSRRLASWPAAGPTCQRWPLRVYSRTVQQRRPQQRPRLASWPVEAPPDALGWGRSWPTAARWFWGRRCSPAGLPGPLPTSAPPTARAPSNLSCDFDFPAAAFSMWHASCMQAALSR